jgi:Integrase core domain
LNVEWFVSLADARQKLAKFREHYNHERPHSALADRTPAAFAELLPKNFSFDWHRKRAVGQLTYGCHFIQCCWPFRIVVQQLQIRISGS